MLNITYTKSSALVLLVALALPLQAQSAPPEGCYERIYSQAHLAKQPDQIVGQIAVKFSQKAGDKVAQLLVTTAEQGRVMETGQGLLEIGQDLFCFAPRGDSKNWTCSVECDGGSMEIIRADAKTLLFRTEYLLVGYADQCGGVVDLAEKPGQSVTYKLTRVADSKCPIPAPWQ